MRRFNPITTQNQIDQRSKRHIKKETNIAITVKKVTIINRPTGFSRRII